MMTLSTGAGAVDSVDEARGVVSEVGLWVRADDEVTEAGTAEAEVGLGARAIGAVVEVTEAGTAEAEVGLGARANGAVEAGTAEAEVGLVAQGAESVVEAGVEAGLDTLPVEAEDEVGSGAVNTSSLRSAEALSTPAPEPVEEYIEDAKDSEGGSSNNVFISIFLQSGGKSSSLFESKIIILSPPIEFASLTMATGSKSARVFGITPKASFLILLMVDSGLNGSCFSTSL